VKPAKARARHEGDPGHLEGLEHIPKDAAALVASNHLSYLDGLAVAYGVHRGGRRPRFLTKSGLFEVPVIGAFLRAIGQIPNDRRTCLASARSTSW